MFSNKIFQGTEPGLNDLLNLDALIGNGLILLKNGALMKGLYYKAADIESATEAERNQMTRLTGIALSHCDGQWSCYVQMVRLPSSDYPAPSATHFREFIPHLMDTEFRDRFLSEGNHYESYYVMVFIYSPPHIASRKILDAFYDRSIEEAEQSSLEKSTAYFTRKLAEIEDSLKTVLTVRWMSSYSVVTRNGIRLMRDELVNFLHFCITGLTHPINLPPVGVPLDSYLGGQELVVGENPIIGDKSICCITLEGFPPEACPQMLHILELLPISFRFSVRYLFLEMHDVLKKLNKHRRQWLQKDKPLHLKIIGASGMVNADAVNMAEQLEAAINDVNSGLLAYGDFTATIVLTGEDRSELRENARLISRELQREGFGCRIETLNTVESWLGSIPGHLGANVRKYILSSQNLADLIPLSSLWTGHERHPCPYYPVGSVALLKTSAGGTTPFHFNTHVGDVGHTLILGPTGAGKTTFLAVMAAQALKYPGMTVCVFEKGRGMYVLTEACNGQHYDIGASDSPTLAPGSVLETAADCAWFEEYLAACYELQTQHPPTPQQREEIRRSIMLIRHEQHPENRSLSDFITNLQDENLRAALSYYTDGGALGNLLDSPSDGLKTGHFLTFELEEIMAMGDKAAIPVLLYLFRRFERSLKGQPSMLILDEAWIMLGHKVFREKIREWLKTLRKANCAVVLATQSLSDAVRSGIFDVLVESCPTKILLPNEEADKTGTPDHPGPRDLYQMMGLNETQIDLLKNAIKKKHYYYISPEGRRLFELGLGPVSLAFTAISDKAQVARVRELKARHGAQWPFVWMDERRVNYRSLIQKYGLTAPKALTGGISDE